MKDKNTLRQLATGELGDLFVYEQIQKINRELGNDDSPILAAVVAETNDRLRKIELEIENA
jgi:hypothetical protein